MDATEPKAELVSGTDFLEELEELREQVSEGRPLGERRLPSSFEEAVALKRRTGDGPGHHRVNRNFERYLRVPDAKLRRAQLRKTVDEAGQDIFGGRDPSHTELSRIVARAFGVTDEEMDRNSRADPTPQSLITLGWWMYLHREYHWTFGIASALVSEGEKLNPKRREMTLRHMDELRELYESWGMQDVDQATMRDDIHADVDVEHSNLDADVIRDYIDTPELQEEWRRQWVMMLHKNIGRRL